MGFLSSLFGSGKKKLRIQTLLAQNPVLLDVRTAREFESGSVPGAINIPLDQLPAKVNVLKKDVPVITFCASGMRSQAARDLLVKRGYQTVENAGGWKTLNAWVTEK